MGCDIHLYKEKQVNGKWLTADDWSPYNYGDEDRGIEVPFEKRFTDRNYNLFGVLARGVRREFDFSFEPRGLPFNACEQIASQSDSYGVDGHSHSYLYLHELKDMFNFLQSEFLPISGMKNSIELDVFRKSIQSGNPNWNLLYPYCQATNAQGYETFEVAVPADFIVGPGLEKIISSFDGIDGDNHRIVFFFDN